MKRIRTLAACTFCALAALQISGCGTPKKPVEPSVPETPAVGTSKGGYLNGDGPQDDIPERLEAIPDAVPRVEPLHRYANRPYVALGKTYVPLTLTGNYKERGTASWYGKKFHGQRTSVGEIYDMYAMTAAHPTLPIPSYARVTNLSNHKSVVVRVNDRGPFLHDRIIDLSYTAAYKLGIIADGSAEVEVESINAEEIKNPDVAANVDVSRQQNVPGPSPVNVAPASAVTVAPIGNGPSVEVAPLATGDTGIFLQLGAFKSQSGAEEYLEKMRSALGAGSKPLKLANKDGLVRVQLGPYASEAEARSSAESLQAKLGFKPMLSMP
jgi:rare lipoprotein A